MPDYCNECGYPLDENGDCMCASVCPCGCNDDHRLPCVYDTPSQRHLKNIMNGKPDEPWVIDGMKASTPVMVDICDCYISVPTGNYPDLCAHCGKKVRR
jgi:hypothetical protein